MNVFCQISMNPVNVGIGYLGINYSNDYHYYPQNFFKIQYNLSRLIVFLTNGLVEYLTKIELLHILIPGFRFWSREYKILLPLHKTFRFNLELFIDNSFLILKSSRKKCIGQYSNGFNKPNFPYHFSSL